MKIKLNGEDKVLNNQLSLYDFVIENMNGKEPKGIAVALNERIIPKQKWESVTIHENDSVEIVHAVQGG
jgi:sulfur carrier protein